MGRGQKKGKSMGDKLAKMSVEQRKQYLEKKAAQEEENLRRREELIGAFLKKKLADEQRMGRINEAKLNTKWRIILRKTKSTALKIQLESLVLGTEEAAAAQDRLACVLRAQLQQTYAHRTAALHAHAHATSLLTGEHEEQLQSLTSYLRQQQQSILSASAHQLQSLCSHFLHQMYHLHIVVLAVKEDCQTRQQIQSEAHLEHLDLIAARQEDEAATRVAAKKVEVEAAQDEVALLQQEHVEDVGLLQEECRVTQIKLHDVTTTLLAAQNTVSRMQAELSAPPEAEAVGEGSAMVREELERLQKKISLLQTGAAAAEQRNEAAIRAANARAEVASKRLESVLTQGRQVLKTWSLCCKLQTHEDKLLPFLPPDPRVEALKRETELNTVQPETLENKFQKPEVIVSQRSDLHPNDGLSDRKGSSKGGGHPAAPSDSGLGTSLVGSSEGDSFRPVLGGTLPVVVESPAVSRLLADESAARSAVAADDIQTQQSSTADQHDYTIAQAENILRSHESIARVTRQLQSTKLQRSNLRAKEKRLRQQVQQLTQTLRSRIHRLGASDAALAAASAPPLQAAKIII